MKKFIFLFALLVSLGARSQAVLGISPYDFILYNDSISPNGLDSADCYIVNSSGSGTAFTGQVAVHIMVQDSALPSFHMVDTVFSSPALNIGANDSVQMRIYQYMNISPAAYHYDINVIVIWPAASGASTSDSLAFVIYIVDTAAGMGEIDPERLIKAYPNPTQGSIFLESTPLSPIEEVRIYDSRGQLLFSRPDAACIKTESWTPGVYLLQVILENKVSRTIRVIKQK
jgi:hypothetical protein